MKKASDGYRSSYAGNSESGSFRRTRSYRPSQSRMSGRSSVRYSRTSMMGGKTTRGTEGLVEKIQVMDEGVDRTPKPMPGVKTHAISSCVTEDSKGSASEHSDLAFDRMSLFSLDAGTATDGVALSPASLTEPSKPSYDKGAIQAAVAVAEKEDLSIEASEVSIVKIVDKEPLTESDLNRIHDVVLYSSDIRWTLDLPGIRQNKETEEANRIQVQNAEYQLLMKAKLDNPEKYIDSETQTMNKLKKSQDTQTLPLVKCDQASQVTSWDIYDTFFGSKTNQIHNEGDIVSSLKQSVTETADRSRNNQPAYSADRRESTSDGQSLIDRASSISGAYSYHRYSHRESVISTSSFPAAPEQGIPDALQLSTEEGSADDKDSKMVDLLKEMSGLQEALHVIDCMTVQKQYIDKQLGYRGISAQITKARMGEAPENVETGSIGNRSLMNRKATNPLSARPSLLLRDLGQKACLKTESVSNADDDQETMSVATDLENCSENIRPRVNTLWQWKCALVEGKTATCMKWKPHNDDLLAVGYGNLKFTPNSSEGLVCFWSIKHVKEPQWYFKTSSSDLAFVGMVNGTVSLFDVQNKSGKEIMHSTLSDGQHTEPVWQLEWKAEGEKEESLISISGDGRVMSWSVTKGLNHVELMKLKRVSRNKTEHTGDSRTPFISRLTGGMCFALHPTDTTMYLAGTDDGWIHKCSMSYSEQYMDSFRAHMGSVYSVVWSPYRDDLFLSCGSDWTICLWLVHRSNPILTFNTTKDQINDLQWCPFHSTVFVAITSRGKVEVWDISISTIKPIAYYMVAGCQLTKISFHPKHKTIVCGTDRGSVIVFSLVNIFMNKQNTNLHDHLNLVLTSNILKLDQTI